MKTFTVEMTEEQMRLLRAAALNVLMQNNKNPGVLTDEEHEEFDLLAGMIFDVLEEGDQEAIHGFCY